MLLLTAAQADRAARHAAAHLAARGITAGQRIAVVTPEYAASSQAPAAQADALALVWAALRSGVIPVMIHPLLTAPEREFLLADSQVSATVATPAELASFTQPITSDDISDVPLTRPMHYTSGTTGTPKGVVARGSPQDATQWWLDEMEQWGFAPTDITLVHSPLCHSAPLRFAIGTLQAGGSVALAGKFNAAAVSEAMRQAHPTTAFTTPSQMAMLLDAGAPASTYRLLAHAGSACPPRLKRRIHEWAGAERTFEFYGSTEGQFTSCRGTEWQERPGTVGRARPGRTLLTDERDQIWCAAPPFARFEYWGDQDKTAAAWRDTPQGPAFTVGDLGRVDDDGYLFLDGRREDLIISGGVNVYPAEVEAVLSAHPGVIDVAVFPIADDKWGQRVGCALVTDVPSSSVQEWAKQRLAGYKRPKDWIVVHELPRNSMGKLRRTQLAGEMGLESTPD